MVADLELLVTPADPPAGHTAIEILLGGLIVGDVDLLMCDPCRLAVVDHIRIDPRCRRRGLATRALDAVLATWPEHRWSTAPIDDTPEAMAFWRSLDWPGPLGRPDGCAHLGGAEPGRPGSADWP
ncbi:MULTISPECIES: GNAT family N-acetyltransferase [Saccharopolyspora]|uniref:GNAT family N-acetyltransferase n=1 Tax=Saccharopolyspora cebuensis TaxID=418759 RepID=A0ABV4CMY7_9PSEU